LGNAIDQFKDGENVDSRIQVNHFVLGLDKVSKKQKVIDFFKCETRNHDYWAGHLVAELELNYFIRNAIKWRVNVVTMDFVDFYPDLIKFLIGSNFAEKRLFIKKALLNGRDYTYNMRSLVTR
jgi:hypothetical protein